MCANASSPSGLSRTDLPRRVTVSAYPPYPLEIKVEARNYRRKYTRDASICGRIWNRASTRSLARRTWSQPEKRERVRASSTKRVQSFACRGILPRNYGKCSKAYPAAFLPADRIYTSAAMADCTYIAHGELARCGTMRNAWRKVALIPYFLSKYARSNVIRTYLEIF